ncbi:hypothetical protein Hanom_Chr09g00769071 [Helianthus anomalus]
MFSPTLASKVVNRNLRHVSFCELLKPTAYPQKKVHIDVNPFMATFVLRKQIST